MKEPSETAILRARIAELEGEVKRLDLNGIHTCHDECRRLPCVQRREIAALKANEVKLREALEKIESGKAVMIDHDMECYVPETLYREEMQEIARAALSQTDGGEHE